MRAFIAVTSALSDENRVRIVAALHRHGELCVCQIVEFLGLAPSTVSKHLSLLNAAALVDGRKEGRWMYYRVADREVPEPARKAIKWVAEVLKDDSRVAADDILVRQILSEIPEELCKRQAARSRGSLQGPGGENSACCSSVPATRAAARWPKASRRHLRSDLIEAYSAGVDPHGMNPRAIAAMAEAGVDISATAGYRSKHVDELRSVAFDYVITVCGHAAETCPLFPGQARVVHVGFDDPPKLARDARADTDAAAMPHYRRVRDEIRRFIETFEQTVQTRA